jgi:PiT family inorganic phosphate transporter
MGNELNELPLVAALIVAVVTASLETFLSWIGIPASFVVIATMSIVGLGWGRATRTATVSQTVSGERAAASSVGALAADAESAPTVGGQHGTPDAHAPTPIGEEDPADIPATTDLFEPGTTARVLFLQNAVPVIATVAAYLLFRFVAIVG